MFDRKFYALAVLALAAGCPADDTVNHLPDAPKHGDGGNDDGGNDPDGQPGGPTSCLEPLHTTAAAMVTLTGSVTDGTLFSSASGNALADVAVSVVRNSGASLGSTTTDVSGTYQAVATTGDVAIDGYVKFTKSGFTELRYFPRAPLFKSGAVRQLPLLVTGDIAQLAATYGVTQDPAKGAAFVRLVDCLTSPQAGFTVTVTGSGSTVKYLDQGGNDAGSSTDTAGYALVFNLPAGNVTIGAIKGSTLDHEHVVLSGSTWLSYVELSER